MPFFTQDNVSIFYILDGPKQEKSKRPGRPLHPWLGLRPPRLEFPDRLTTFALFYYYLTSSLPPCTGLLGPKVPENEDSAKYLEFSLCKGILLKVHQRKFKLEDIIEVINLMNAGQVQDGRMVLEFSG
jgi:hypothetical protein